MNKTVENLEIRINKASETIENADYIIIGAGAGLSDAAGIKYDGKRFKDNFDTFISKYNFRDLYTSSFYSFQSEEERWAYWAKHISVNLFEQPVTQLYLDLFKLIKNKDYFVITTNVERQFLKARFESNRVFAVQGDYGLLQCAIGCHSKLYPNENLITEMLKRTIDFKIPSELVPCCPVCGGKMDVNLRKDNNFVENENWNASAINYKQFIKKATTGKTVLIELGVGFNTPEIIRYPFEAMTFHFSEFTLIRMNSFHPHGLEENIGKTIPFVEDINFITNALLQKQII